MVFFFAEPPTATPSTRCCCAGLLHGDGAASLVSPATSSWLEDSFWPVDVHNTVRCSRQSLNVVHTKQTRIGSADGRQFLLRAAFGDNTNDDPVRKNIGDCNSTSSKQKYTRRQGAKQKKIAREEWTCSQSASAKPTGKIAISNV